MDPADKVHPVLIRAVREHGVDVDVILALASEVAQLYIAASMERGAESVNTRRLLDLALLGLSIERGQIPHAALLTDIPGLP